MAMASTCLEERTLSADGLAVISQLQRSEKMTENCRDKPKRPVRAPGLASASDMPAEGSKILEIVRNRCSFPLTL